MLIIPAIDLMKGKVVRLRRGDPKTAKDYDYLGDPVQIAEKWKEEGAKKLHIIDLDAALNTGDNLQIIQEIAKTVDLPIQVGGGIRNIETVERMISLGASDVILGSLAFKNPKAIIQLTKKFGQEFIIVALDNKNGEIMVDGWKTGTEVSIEKALKSFIGLRINTFLITSVARDGTLAGPDVDTLTKVCLHSDVKVIAAGGIGCLMDLIVLKRIGVEGVVVGKALYEGRFTLRQALKTVAEGLR